MKHFVKIKLFNFNRYVSIDISEISSIVDSIHVDTSYGNKEYPYIQINTKQGISFNCDGTADVITTQIESISEKIFNSKVDTLYFAISKLGF